MPGTAEVLALEAAGCRVTVVSLTPPQTGAEDVTAARAEVLYPPQPVVQELPRRFPPDDAGWRAMIARAASGQASGAPECAAWYFAGALHRRGVQLVHVAGGKAALRAAVLLRQSGLACSFAAGAALAAEGEMTEWLAAADLVMASSDAAAAALREAHPQSAGKVVTVRPGIDASRYPAALCGGAGAMRVLFSPGDAGTAAVMESMNRLHALGLEAELMLAAHQSAAEMKRQLAAADVYVHGGGSENGLLEAMAAGLPVVSLAEEAGEPLHEGRTGWQVPGGDPAALTARLATLAEQPALRSSAGQAGLDRVQAHFSLGRRAARMVEEFRRVLEGRFAPAVTARDAGVLCLLESWPAPGTDALLAEELRFLSAQPAVDLLAARLGNATTAPPAGMEFLPDALVLEYTWQQHPELAAKTLALRSVCPEVNGEDFLLHARRAVFLASQCAARGWRHVHALRSTTLLTAWLLRRIAGITASATLEPGHALPASALTPLASAFRFGSSADPAFASASIAPVLHPAPPAAKKRLFSSAPAPVAVHVPDQWTAWLRMARV
jgi:hypothetical protein